jgi:hypothetical protein
MLLVQLGINSTSDVWKFAKLDSPRRLVQFWQNFQTSLVLLIPNCTRHHMITYIYTGQLHINTRFRKVRHLGYRASFSCMWHQLKSTSQSRKRGSVAKVTYFPEACILRPRLHETGTKSNRDHFVSVIVLFIIDVYMRPGRK